MDNLKKAKNIEQVAIFGSAHASPDSELATQVFAVCKRLAETGYIVFNGGTGTISEFGMAWGLAKLYFGHHKPLILYGQFWENIMNTFKENMIITKEEREVYKIVDSPEGVLDAIMQFEEELEKGEHQHIKTTRGDFTN